jgi:hypothetical protein
MYHDDFSEFSWYLCRHLFPQNNYPYNKNVTSGDTIAISRIAKNIRPERLFDKKRCTHGIQGSLENAKNREKSDTGQTGRNAQLWLYCHR